MFYVYLLTSIADPSQRYVGFTTDLKQRLKSITKRIGAHGEIQAVESGQLFRLLTMNAERESSNFI